MPIIHPLHTICTHSIIDSLPPSLHPALSPSGSVKVAPVTKKITDKRPKWYGHVKRTDEGHVVRTMLDASVLWRQRGRQKTMWKDSCKIYIYIYTSWIPGFARDPLSRSFSPPSLIPLSPLSYSSLPSTLPPSDYPASLRITAFPRYVLNLEA